LCAATNRVTCSTSGVKSGLNFHVPIASLLRALNPAKVVVAGGVSQIGEMYMAEVRRVAHQRAKGLAGQSPILLATLGTQANLVGAAELAWQGLGHR
jgi:predicted NBD/HSP70 family sugar kinase